MATLFEIISDANAVLELEPEELAGLALELINSESPNTASRLHPTSFTHLVLWEHLIRVFEIKSRLRWLKDGIGLSRKD